MCVCARVYVTILRAAVVLWIFDVKCRCVIWLARGVCWFVIKSYYLVSAPWMCGGSVEIMLYFLHHVCVCVCSHHSECMNILGADAALLYNHIAGRRTHRICDDIRVVYYTAVDAPPHLSIFAHFCTIATEFWMRAFVCVYLRSPQNLIVRIHRARIWHWMCTKQTHITHITLNWTAQVPQVTIYIVWQRSYGAPHSHMHVIPTQRSPK